MIIALRITTLLKLIFLDFSIQRCKKSQVWQEWNYTELFWNCNYLRAGVWGFGWLSWRMQTACTLKRFLCKRWTWLLTAELPAKVLSALVNGWRGAGASVCTVNGTSAYPGAETSPRHCVLLCPEAGSETGGALSQCALLSSRVSPRLMHLCPSLCPRTGPGKQTPS